jgi:hypothetical protein
VVKLPVNEGHLTTGNYGINGGEMLNIWRGEAIDIIALPWI